MRKRTSESMAPSAWSAKERARRRRANKAAKAARKRNR
jgi:hypothetical protein